MGILDTFNNSPSEPVDFDKYRKKGSYVSVHHFIRKILENRLAVERSAVQPWASLYTDLGMDELDFKEILSDICDRLEFKEASNSFYAWVNKTKAQCDTCLQAEGKGGTQAFMDIAVIELERRVLDANPVSFKQPE